MDQVDLLILKESWNQDNDPSYGSKPRYTVNELGKKVGKSAGATQTRLVNLRKAGYIYPVTGRPGRSIRITPLGIEVLLEQHLIPERMRV